MKRVLVLMAGGSGTRLASLTGGIPKQFLPLAGARPMLAEALEAARPVAEEVLVVASRRWSWAVRQVLPSLKPGELLVEPRGCNTGPCLVLAASVARGRWGDALLACLPADFHAGDVRAFRRALEASSRAALETGGLVALAARPTRPEPGFGYMLLDGAPGSLVRRRVLRFVEKPSPERAQRLVGEGWVWNTGMYFFKASVFLEEARRYLPDAWREIVPLPLSLRSGKPRREDLRAAYARVTPVSVDYAVSQRTRRLWAVVGDFGWDDISTVEAALRIGGPGLRARVAAWRRRLKGGGRR